MRAVGLSFLLFQDVVLQQLFNLSVAKLRFGEVDFQSMTDAPFESFVGPCVEQYSDE